MFPGTISLALCTVVIRRCFDALSGTILTPSSTSNVSHISSMFMISGALIYLYSHLRKGTLVRIGQGHRHSFSGSKNISLRGSKHNKSWFLKNLWGKRKCCTDAIFKIAKHFSDSLTNINPCLLLPKSTFQVSFPESREQGSRTSSSHNSESISEDSYEFIFSKDPYQNEVSDMKQQNKGTKDTKDNLAYAAGDNVNIEKRKRPRHSFVKRLDRKKIIEDVTVKQSKSSNIFRSGDKRRTRSGRVYNPFS